LGSKDEILSVIPPRHSKPVFIARGKSGFPIAPKAFDVLRYLVENPGRLVTQDEILDKLWSETYVNPEVFRKYILDIRKIL